MSANANPLPIIPGKAAFVGDDREAQINADFTVPVIVDTRQMDWSDSPMPNVFRKRLELLGEHNPQLTTLVKFAEKSYFKSHEHDGGEEFLVLDGVFSDGFGDFPKGSYVRNPPGTQHQPFTEPGCTILVKLRQFQNGDEKQFSRNVLSASNEKSWYDTESHGVRQMSLHHYKKEQVGMFQFQKNSQALELTARSGLEMYIFSGQVQINQVDYDEAYWLRYPAQTRLTIQSYGEAMVWFKQY